MKKQIIFALLLVHAFTALAQLKPFPFEGAKRKYLIYIPASYHPDSAQPWPLVFNFHGGGMTVAEQMLYTGMNETADKHHFIVVYPAGIDEDWNVGYDMDYQGGTNDTGFIMALLDSLKQEYRIDPKAVFATGLSRGGFFCHRLAAEMPEVFAAVASVGAPLPDSVKHYHRSAEKISVMQVHGTADEIVKYGGKTGGYASAMATFHYWLNHNRLQHQKVSKRQTDIDLNDGTRVESMEVSDQNTTVSLLTVENGGHTWPGRNPFNIGYPLGKTTQDIDINELMWQFFDRNRKL